MNVSSLCATVTVFVAHFALEQSTRAAPPVYPDKSNLMVFRDAHGVEHPVLRAEDWQRRRADILENMQLVMGPLPDQGKRVALAVETTEEVRAEKHTRRTISFATEPGDRLPGCLLVPHEHRERLPAVLCLHQTTKVGKDEPAGLAGSPNLHYAAELAERGYVTLAVDYPNFGTYQFDPYANGYSSATMKGIWNHMRAVDLLQSLAEVDPERIGVIGHSLGGHNSLFVAAFDPRIKCVVTNCGFCSFARYYDGNLAGWSHKGYMPRIGEVYALDPRTMPFDFTEVVAAIAPRAVLAIAPKRDGNFAVAGVEECITAARPVFHLLGADEKLAAHYPDCEHDFPPECREIAYRWFDRWLIKASRPEGLSH